MVRWSRFSVAALVVAAGLMTGINDNVTSYAYACTDLTAHANLTAYRAARVLAAPQTGAADLTDCDEMLYVNCDVLNCRTSPEIASGNVSGNLRYGDKVQRVAKGSEWSAVLVNGKKRYAASRYLSPNPPSASNTSGSSNSAGSSDAAEKAAGAAISSGSAAESGGAAVSLNSGYKYAEFSKINSGSAVLYKSAASNRKGKVVCVNAGHGTKGGGSVKTLCHPDGTPKVTGGTTGAGATTAVAVSSGMTFADGTAESKVTLKMAKLLKERLLAQGYDVLMIRESDDAQLDNVARTVIANNNADCHIALHWDSTSSNKGAFFMSVPNHSSYRAMEPVASHWQQHNKLGEALVNGLKGAGNKIFSGGSMEMDLTQTSYSTIPSVDIELGDKASDHSDAALGKLADGLTAGVNAFFGF